MKKIFYIVLVFLCCINFSCKKGLTEENITIPFMYKDMYGFIDSNFNVIIEPKYAFYRVVDNSGYCACYDKVAKRFIIFKNGEPIYIYSRTEYYSVSHVYDSFFSIEGKGTPWFTGLFDAKTGEFVYTMDGGRIYPSDKGIPIFPVDTIGIRKGCFYMNTSGKKLFNGKIFSGKAMPFSEGYAIVSDEDPDVTDNYFIDRIINKKGKYTTDSSFIFGFQLDIFSEGLIAGYREDGKSGYFDYNGNCVIEIPLYYKIDYSATPFYNGYAFVMTRPTKRGGLEYWRSINKKGEFQSEEIACNQFYDISDGYALIYIEEKGIQFIDCFGKPLADKVFENGSSFRNGYAMIVLDGKEGLLDTKGNIYYSEDIVAGKYKNVK